MTPPPATLTEPTSHTQYVAHAQTENVSRFHSVRYDTDNIGRVELDPIEDPKQRPHGRTPSGIAFRALFELKNLEANWDSYGAPPPNARSLFEAQRILTRLVDEEAMSPSRVVPSAEGGVGIVFVQDDRYADFECFNDGAIAAVISDRSRGTPKVWNVDDRSLSDSIQRIREFLDAGQRSAATDVETGAPGRSRIHG